MLVGLQVSIPVFDEVLACLNGSLTVSTSYKIVTLQVQTISYQLLILYRQHIVDLHELASSWQLLVAGVANVLGLVFWGARIRATANPEKLETILTLCLIMWCHIILVLA